MFNPVSKESSFEVREFKSFLYRASGQKTPQEWWALFSELPFPAELAVLPEARREYPMSSNSLYVALMASER